MNRIFLITVLLIIGVLNSFAQNKPNHQSRKFNLEKFKKQKADYIVSEVGLTSNEAALFIPLMDELLQKKFELNRNLRKESRNLKNKDNVSDEDYDRYINFSLQSGLQEAELNKEYFEKFRKILSPQKIYKYKEAETQFMKQTIEKNVKSK